MNKNIRSFNEYCYACNIHGHKTIECWNKNFIRNVNGNVMYHGSVYYNFKVVGYIEFFCKSNLTEGMLVQRIWLTLKEKER